MAEQGWGVSSQFHPQRGLHLEVTDGRSTIWLYRPKDRSLVIHTSYSLSERQLIRLFELDRAQYLDLIWKLKTVVKSGGFVLELLPHGAELTHVRAAVQLWEPAISKNSVLRDALRMLGLPELIHAVLESRLSVIAPWELESPRALVSPPGDKPIVRLIP
jgi:hypothetical protein